MHTHTSLLTLFCFFGALLASCTLQSQTQITPNDPLIAYEGRIKHNDQSATLMWSGSSVTVAFEGSGLSVDLMDSDTANYYNVILDQKVLYTLHTDTVRTTYSLVNDLPKGKHTLTLFKRTEWDKGSTQFFGFTSSDNNAKLFPITPKKRKIEFYGNSITCGYANEDFEGKDRGIGYYENNYLTYAHKTAQHFNAQYHCTAKSGIGILVSWFPMIMPEMYDRLDPNDAQSKWDFSKYTPDVVVINLFQNDSWLTTMKNHAEFKRCFGETVPTEEQIIKAYKSFVSSVRAKYPNASIICALGSMNATKEGSNWPGYVQTAVTELNDAKMYTCFFPYKKTSNHPLISEHEVMAQQLISFIEKNIEW